MLKRRTFLVGLILMANFGIIAQADPASAGHYLDDATLTTKVKAALLTDHKLRATKITVKTTEGIVRLTGNVGTKIQEIEAVSVANQVDGVKSTVNMLSVNETKAQ